jgi:hypothetical protein
MIPRHFLIGMAAMTVVVLGMCVYVWRMRQGVEQTESAPVYTRPVAAPASGPTEQVTLFVAFDEPGALRAQSARIPLPAGRQERAQELLHALLDLYLDRSSSHPLGPGAEIRDVYLVDPGLAVIDTNAAFANGHRSGILVEELTIASMVQTLSTNIPGIARVKILVDGKTRETLAGHADLSGIYDVSAINQVASRLQSAE